MKYFAVFALCIIGAITAPLNHDDAQVVKATWDQVRHHEVDILHSIFKAHPDIQARFPQFVGKDLESIKDTATFATHAGRIVGFISELMGLMGNESNAPALKHLVHELGVSHRNRGIPEEQFNEFRASLTDYLSHHAKWDDHVAALWKQAGDNTFTMLFETLHGH